MEKPRFRLLWNRVYMIEKPMLVMCWPDVDVLMFYIDGSFRRSC